LIREQVSEIENARIRVVKYDFAQLVEWKRVVGDIMRTMRGVNGSGIDVVRNAVSIGVGSEGSLEDVRIVAERAGVAPDALHLYPDEPFRRLQGRHGSALR
jgi:hypothetical protein